MAGRKITIERTITNIWRCEMVLEDGETVQELCEKIRQYEDDTDNDSCLEWELTDDSATYAELKEQ